MAGNRNPISCGKYSIFAPTRAGAERTRVPPSPAGYGHARLGDFRAAGAFRLRATAALGSLAQPGATPPAAAPQAKATRAAHLSQLLNRLPGQLSPRSRIWDPLPTEFFDDRPDPALQIRSGILD